MQTSHGFAKRFNFLAWDDLFIQKTLATRIKHSGCEA